MKKNHHETQYYDTNARSGEVYEVSKEAPWKTPPEHHDQAQFAKMSKEVIRAVARFIQDSQHDFRWLVFESQLWIKFAIRL